LKGLQAMIRHVYLPLMENRLETRLHMEKFQKQINISLQQAYGTVTVRVPMVPSNKDDDDIKRDKRTMEEFQNAVVSARASVLRPRV
jgi:hypothetical protein